MPRFFVEEIKGNEMVLTGENASHIARSLRMRCGDIITLSDANGLDCEAKLTSVSPDEVTVTILETRCNTSEPTVKVTLFQALPKVGKFETIVQKSVELGVYNIVPIITSRCVSRPDAKSMQKKVERYNKIALVAAKQSGRGLIPKVESLLTFDEMLKCFSQFDYTLLFYEEGGSRLEELLPEEAKNVAIVIGSEGGFSPEEVKKAREAGALIGTLGPRILRCETAPITALSIVMFRTKNI